QGATGLPADFVPLRLILQATGSALELTRPVMVLGRHSEADIRLPLPDVSRRHCQLSYVNGAWHVRDLKSLNGTFLNDKPIEEALLCHGDRLRVGGFTFGVDFAAAQTARKDEMVLPLKPAFPATLSPDNPPGEPIRKAS